MRLILSFVRHCIDNNLVPSRIDNALTRMNRRTIHVHTNIFHIQHNFIPVSYTHLDVYKRQGL